MTYGACCPIAQEAAEQLQAFGIEMELIDVRTLIPFDLHGVILDSLRKTNRILFLDEDCPGGATAYMMQKVLEEQNGFAWLECAPRTLAAKEHRPAYGSDGDYFSKPNREQIFEAVYEIMHEVKSNPFPEIYVTEVEGRSCIMSVERLRRLQLQRQLRLRSTFAKQYGS